MLAPCPADSPQHDRLPRPAERRAARGRRDRRRAAAGAGRRRHRQDPRADHPLRPYPADQARLARARCWPSPSPTRRRARCASGSAPSSAGRPRGCGSARSTRCARACCAGTPSWSGCTPNFTILDTDDQLRLLKQVMEAERIDTKRWAPPALMAMIQRWKDRGLTAGARHRRPRTRDFANGRARALYAAYQDRLRTLNAADFGDLLLHMTEILRDAARRAGAVPPAVPLHPGGRIPGHQPGAVSLAAAAGAGPPQHLLRRRRRPVDLFLARRGGGKHPALREGFSRRAHRPAGGQLPLDRADPRRRLRPDRAQRGPARQDAAPGARGRRRREGRRWSACGIPTRKPAWSATASRRCAARATRWPRWRCWCAPASRPAPSRSG